VSGPLAGFLADLAKPTRTPGQVVTTVHRVLDRPEYQHPGPSLFERLQHDVGDWIARVLSGVVGAGVGAWIALALIVGLVVLVVWRLGGGVARDPGRGIAVSAGRSRPATEWRAEAEAHERAGEWRQAVRCRYRALVAEYRAELNAALPAGAASFRGATDLFEGAWYGRRPTAAADSARFRELADRVLEAAR